MVIPYTIWRNAGNWLISFCTILILQGCHPQKRQEQPYVDRAFWQEDHKPYPVSTDAADNDVRSIAVGPDQTVWIATATGIFRKRQDASVWEPVLTADHKGPAFSVGIDQAGTVWLGTWQGLFRYADYHPETVEGTSGPVTAVSPAPEGTYALGPQGIWLVTNGQVIKKGYAIPRSVRNALPDGQGGIWIASDVGLYHCTPKSVDIYQSTKHLLSAYVKGLAYDGKQQLWAAGLGGVSQLANHRKTGTLTPEDGLPTIYATCVERAPDSTMWVGTEQGVVRFRPDGTHSLLFSQRWLLDDRIADIAFDKAGTAWIATPKGVSAIRKRSMTLAQKSDYFYDVLMKRHIREPWIAGQCRLPVAGDASAWEPEDDDNDGEYTGNYLAMEAFRYAATKSPDAKAKAAKAFRFLRLLQEVTGTDGFFARTIVPANWDKSLLHDVNRAYTGRELAAELAKEPRFKPVQVRWQPSKDGKWLWKGDTSSDEMCGHMFGYFFYYELVADEAEKQLVRTHIRHIVDHLIKHNFNLVDVDGKPTRWGVWSPEQLNHDPEWAPDRSQNSMEMLTFLKLAYHVTNDTTYQQQYLRLIQKEGYLDNMANLPNQNPAWFIYFDVVLQAYCYPILLACEKDPTLLAFYQNHMDSWFDRRRNDHNPLINFLYNYARNKQEELATSIAFFENTPLDLIDWPIDHTKREDIRIVRKPVLDDVQVSELQPPALRLAIRWDKNPWTATGGDPHREREPVFWLLPYWMGRYLGIINE